MRPLSRIFNPAQPVLRRVSWADAIVVGGLIGVLFLIVKSASIAPVVTPAQPISSNPRALPLYAFYSTARMFGAYILSIIFSIAYGYKAASSKKYERILMPILDILQSVPILSYMPIVVMGLTAFLPDSIAKEFAAVVLIFTSQAWNITFSWFQSVTTVPSELREAESIFRFTPWMRFNTVDFPFGAIGLIWNSVMSWAGGWFALMAAEMFRVGSRDYRLPGIGSFIQQAADDKNFKNIGLGVGVLVLLIVTIDQLMWRPLLAWADKFRLDMVATEETPRSWIYDAFAGSRLMRHVRRRFFRPFLEKFDNKLRSIGAIEPMPKTLRSRALWTKWLGYGLYAVLAIVVFESLGYLVQIPLKNWLEILLGLLATMTRVFIALALALAWTVPLGVAIGTNQKLAKILQPLTQMVASIPATALYPLFLVGLLGFRGGLEIAAMLLMLAGTQWYLLFNVIAGARAIPQDLKYTSQLMNLTGINKWKTFILPALFPYIATGAITASGGAWNASIFAEYTKFGGANFSTAYGIGAYVARSQDQQKYPLLLASTLVMVLAVITINRLVWKRIYKTAEEKYRLV